MKRVLTAVALFGLGAWLLSPSRGQAGTPAMAGAGASEGASSASSSLNHGERLAQTGAFGANQGIARGLPETEANSDSLAVLGSEPPKSDRIDPGLPDYLRRA